MNPSYVPYPAGLRPGVTLSSPIPGPRRSSVDHDDDRIDEWIAENEEVLENDFTFRAVSVGLLVGYVR